MTFGMTTKARSVATIVAALQQQQSTTSPTRELAMAIHDFVRDEIAFGFTRQHDRAASDYTLQRRVGHCTPQAELFGSLLRQAGFEEVKLVTVPINGTVLDCLGSGESSPFPNRLMHTFVQVTVDGIPCRVDSYVVDPPLFRAAQKKLNDSANRTAGYGIHAEGTMEWQGNGDAFSQYVPSMQTRELETQVDCSKQIVDMPDYLHIDLMRMLSIPLIGLGMGSLLELLNGNIQALRQHA